MRVESIDKLRGFCSKLIISITQALFFVFIGPFIRAIFRALVTMPKSLRGITRGSLIVANHQSYVDPFFILAHMPGRVFMRLLPIRFPTSHAYIMHPVLYPFLKVLGCYNVGDGPRGRLLAAAKTRDFLRSGTTVLIFPEGKFNKGEIGDFQRGVEFFSEHCAQIAFVRISGLDDLSRNIRLSRPWCGLSWSDAYGNMQMNLSEARSQFDHL